MKQDIFKETCPGTLSCTLHPESMLHEFNLIPVSVLLGSEKAKKVEDEDTHGSIGLHS